MENGNNVQLIYDHNCRAGGSFFLFSLFSFSSSAFSAVSAVRNSDVGLTSASRIRQ
jgi:hypothetical protein